MLALALGGSCVSDPSRRELYINSLKVSQRWLRSPFVLTVIGSLRPFAWIPMAEGDTMQAYWKKKEGSVSLWRTKSPVCVIPCPQNPCFSLPSFIFSSATVISAPNHSESVVLPHRTLVCKPPLQYVLLTFPLGWLKFIFQMKPSSSCVGRSKVTLTGMTFVSNFLTYSGRDK